MLSPLRLWTRALLSPVDRELVCAWNCRASHPVSWNVWHARDVVVHGQPEWAIGMKPVVRFVCAPAFQDIN
eukprot:10031829-Lingulodinium_polyedra.AAC.1